MFGLPQNSWRSQRKGDPLEHASFIPHTNKPSQSQASPNRFRQVVRLCLGQLLLMALGWALIAVMLHHSHWQIPLPDSVARVVLNNPRGTTYAASLIANVLSLSSSWLFSKAVRVLLTTSMFQKSVPLRDFEFLVTWSNVRPFWNKNHPARVMLSLFVLGMVHASTSGWTALLNPTPILLPKDITGRELDISSPAFAELLAGNSTYHYDTGNSITKIDSGALKPTGQVSLAGESAAGRSIGVPSFFNYNGSSYNLSTGGILPVLPNDVIEQYQSRATNLGLSSLFGHLFSWMTGGHHTDHMNTWQNYTVHQQGLTANVTCAPQEQTAILSYSRVTPSFIADLVGDEGYEFWVSNASCNSASGVPSVSTRYVTRVTNSTSENCGPSDGDGFLPIVPCPLQNITQANNNSFVINMYGHCKYSSIASTVCEVTPLITGTVVTYNGGIISQRYVESTYALGDQNPAAMAFLVGLVKWVGATAQGMDGNDMGDSINMLLANISSPNASVVSGMLEDYWRGIVEFGGTFIRYEYFERSDQLASNMASPITGHAYKLTMGWSKGWSLHAALVLIASMVPQTIVCLLTLWVLYSSGGDSLGVHPHFDPTDVSDALLAHSPDEPDYHMSHSRDSTATFVNSNYSGNPSVTGIVPGKRDEALDNKVVELRITEDKERRRLLYLKLLQRMP